MSTYDDAMDTSSDKGKGKAEEPEITEEDSSDEEEETFDEHAIPTEDVEEDDLAEIDPSNIQATRTRGKVIDYSNVDQSDLAADDDDDDDGDFHDKTTTEEADVDRMET